MWPLYVRWQIMVWANRKTVPWSPWCSFLHKPFAGHLSHHKQGPFLLKPQVPVLRAMPPNAQNEKRWPCLSGQDTEEPSDLGTGLGQFWNCPFCKQDLGGEKGNIKHASSVPDSWKHCKPTCSSFFLRGHWARSESWHKQPIESEGLRRGSRCRLMAHIL